MEDEHQHHDQVVVDDEVPEMDFDYIGTGGFLLQCRGGGSSRGETVGVTASQRRRVVERSPFFAQCLALDMREKQSSIVRKEDWTTAVGRHLVEALCKGRTTVSSLETYQEVLQAADQALVDLRLCNLVNYLDPTSQESTREKFLGLLAGKGGEAEDPPSAVVRPGSYYRFRLVANVKSQAWNQLLDRNILLHRHETNYVLRIPEEDHRNGQNNNQGRKRRSHREFTAKQQLDTRVSEYLVYGTRCLTALYSIERTLAHYSKDCLGYTGAGFGVRGVPPMTDRDFITPHENHNEMEGDDDDEDGEESFCLYFETSQTIPARHHQAIDRLAGGEAYVRTCPDAAETRTEGCTVKGSCDVLLRALRPLLHEEAAKRQSEEEAADPVLAPTDQDAAGDPLEEGPKEPGGEHEAEASSPPPLPLPPRAASTPSPPTLGSTMVCSLRVDHPSPDTLGRLINATHEATDYPSTLGIIPPSGRYFCKKTARDIGAILDYMADYSKPSGITRDFTVLECATEDRNPF